MAELNAVFGLRRTGRASSGRYLMVKEVRVVGSSRANDFHSWQRRRLFIEPVRTLRNSRVERSSFKSERTYYETHTNIQHCVKVFGNNNYTFMIFMLV